MKKVLRKNVVLKGIFGSFMILALVFGLAHLTAQPAEASFRCPAQLFGNTFSHVEVAGDICCCIYLTPEGQEVVGPSWYC